MQMIWPGAVVAFAFLAVVAAIVGTDRLGHALTNEEKVRFGALLRQHDYPGARLVALRFAYKLTRTRARAQDLMGRADIRLVRFGWDPNDVSLVKRLCRLVWSEHTHALSETDTARLAEEGFLRELEVTEGFKAQSVEQRAVHQEARRQDQANARTQLEKLRASFEKAGDEVNLLWLDHQLQGETDLQKMAASERPRRDRVLPRGRSAQETHPAPPRRTAGRALRRRGGRVMPKRSAEDVWQQLVDEAGEDAIERAASVSRRAGREGAGESGLRRRCRACEGRRADAPARSARLGKKSPSPSPRANRLMAALSRTCPSRSAKSTSGPPPSSPQPHSPQAPRSSSSSR